jgi:hypothetical protein
MENTYSMSIRPRFIFLVWGVIFCFLIVPIPIGLAMFALMLFAHLKVSPDKFSLWWLAKREFRWEDVEYIKQVKFLPNLLFGGFSQIYSLEYKIKGESRKRRIPYSYFSKSSKILSEVQQYAGAKFQR